MRFWRGTPSVEKIILSLMFHNWTVKPSELVPWYALPRGIIGIASAGTELYFRETDKSVQQNMATSMVGRNLVSDWHRFVHFLPGGQHHQPLCTVSVAEVAII